MGGNDHKKIDVGGDGIAELHICVYGVRRTVRKCNAADKGISDT